MVCSRKNSLCYDILQVSFQKAVLYFQISEIIFRIHSVVTMNKQLTIVLRMKFFTKPFCFTVLPFLSFFLKATCFVCDMIKLKL